MLYYSQRISLSLAGSVGVMQTTYTVHSPLKKPIASLLEPTKKQNVLEICYAALLQLRMRRICFLSLSFENIWCVIILAHECFVSFKRRVLLFAALTYWFSLSVTPPFSFEQKQQLSIKRFIKEFLFVNNYSSVNCASISYLKKNHIQK